MCPLCLSAAAWIAIGGGSASTLALLIGLNRKGFQHGNTCHDTSHRKP
jgi:hypothetical protein